MATIGPLGARHLVILPEGYTDLDGNAHGQPDPHRRRVDGPHDGDVRARPVRGRRARRRARVPHPRGQPRRARRSEIARFLDGTDPETSTLCLDTGHVAYCGADNLALIRDYPDRIRYVHLKQVDPAIRPARRATSGSGFAPAVRLGVMVEPPLGDPDMPAVLAALAALDRELFCIVEQDMYPCDFDVPLPIATRTARVLREPAGSTSGGRAGAAG